MLLVPAVCPAVQVPQRLLPSGECAAACAGVQVSVVTPAAALYHQHAVDGCLVVVTGRLAGCLLGWFLVLVAC